MLWVLLRAAPWRALLSVSAAGAALAAVGLVVPAGVGGRVLEMALVVLGGGAAWALEEPASAVVDACPVRRSTHVLARAVAAGAPLITGATGVIGWWLRHDADRLLALQLVGAWVLGLSFAVIGRTRLDEPGEVVAPALVLSLLSVMYVGAIGRHLVLFPLDEQAERAARTWCALVVVAAVVVALVVRERRWSR